MYGIISKLPPPLHNESTYPDAIDPIYVCWPWSVLGKIQKITSKKEQEEMEMDEMRVKKNSIYRSVSRTI